MKHRIAQIAGGLLLALSAAGNPATAAEPSTGCSADGALRFICGPRNAEDLVRIGSSRWLIASGMDGALTGAGNAMGHLYLVDHQKKSWREAFPGNSTLATHDRTLYAGCPGPVNPANFSAHGIALKERSRGQYRLYVVGHGDREAIEVFDVDARPSIPSLRWSGCVVLPDDVSANSVAILPDWGFVTTKFLDRRLPQAESMAQARQGKLNGAVYEWHPGGPVAAIAGTELSAPNGIEVSPDGRTLYVAVFGTHEFVRFRREGNGVRKDSVPVALSPDNVRWSPGGKLLTVGSNYAGPAAARTTAWTVLEIDPDTLATRIAARGDSSQGMQALSVALAVEGTIWTGTFGGDRIGYIRAR